MEIINKKHDLITSRIKTNVQSFIKISSKKEIRFSITAIRELGLSEGLFIHFINDGDGWSFYVNTDPDGFELKYGRSPNALSIFNMALIILFCKRTFSDIPCAYPLYPSKRRHEGKYVIIDIDTKRSLKPEDYGYHRSKKPKK
jgi:hypothetical protein